jgi:hypothetical protein
MNEKPHDHCLDIIATMADQQPAQGACCTPDRRDYFAILDQLEIEYSSSIRISWRRQYGAGPAPLRTKVSRLVKILLPDSK